MIAYFNDPGIEADYEYDYGDGWVHSVKLEGYMHREKGVKYPVCIDGERAFPPENCGGPDRYSSILEILNDPSHPDCNKVPEWVERWDPEHFNKNDIRFEDPYKRRRGAFLED